MKLSEDVLSKKKVLWWALLIAYCGFIVWMTLLNRPVTTREYKLELFWGIRTISKNKVIGLQVVLQFFQNILLFIPFGFFFPSKNNSRKNTLAIAAVFSTAVELIQYISARGLAETDDVISNTIGAVVGFQLFHLFRKLRDDSKMNKHKPYGIYEKYI